MAILDAGHRLFTERGYAGTSVREIARAAGVAESTTYKAFPDKATLLWAIVEHAVRGPEDEEDDDPGSALLDAVRAEPDAHGRLRVIARWSRETYERGVAELERVIEEAARSNPRLGELAEKAARERYLATRRLTELVAETLPPTDVEELDAIAQFIWATDSSPVYRMLVEQHGWTAAQFEDWIFRLYCAMLPNAGPPRPRL